MKKLIPYITVFLTTLILAFPSKAQNCNLSIRGKVIHLENNQPIPGAYVWLEETKQGVVTDLDGNFLIRNLCQGAFNLKIQFLGHKEIQEKID
ncbi:MAG TPA: TonB-dependent receptor, partial [Algoriphagus sp.]|nr:TonB-dependent receptor [Algoriphagus sp.]